MEREVSRIESISVLLPTLLAPELFFLPLLSCPRPLAPLESPGPQQFPTSFSYLGFYQKCPDPNCKVKKSLHGHHPRDCLFYLRDWPAARLQKLLQVRGGQPGWVCRLLGDRVQDGQEWERPNAGKWDSGWIEGNNALSLFLPRTIMSCLTQSLPPAHGQSLEVSVRQTSKVGMVD